MEILLPHYQFSFSEELIMKLNLVLASVLIIGTISTFAPAAFAFPTSDTVPLVGTVASNLDLISTATAGAGTLDLTTPSAQIVKVSSLHIDTNNAAGYKLTVTSGDLVGTNHPTVTPIAYQVEVVNGGAAAASTFGTASGVDYTTSTSAANADGTNDKDLYIKYTPAALQNPDVYTATIGLSVIDN
jgi:hypothetical protein